MKYLLSLLIAFGNSYDLLLNFARDFFCENKFLLEKILAASLQDLTFYST